MKAHLQVSSEEETEDRNGPQVDRHVGAHIRDRHGVPPTGQRTDELPREGKRRPHRGDERASIPQLMKYQKFYIPYV